MCHIPLFSLQSQESETPLCQTAQVLRFQIITLPWQPLWFLGNPKNNILWCIFANNNAIKMIKLCIPMFLRTGYPKNLWPWPSEVKVIHIFEGQGQKSIILSKGRYNFNWETFKVYKMKSFFNSKICIQHVLRKK